MPGLVHGSMVARERVTLMPGLVHGSEGKGEREGGKQGGMEGGSSKHEDLVGAGKAAGSKIELITVEVESWVCWTSLTLMP